MKTEKRRTLFRTAAAAVSGILASTVIISSLQMPMNVYAAAKTSAAKETAAAKTAAGNKGQTASDSDDGEMATVSPEQAGSETVNPSGEADLDNSGIWALDEKHAPVIQAESAILMDAESGAVLYAKNIHTEHYPASITKILTALLAQENSKLTDTVTFSKNAVYGIDRGSSNIGLDVGQSMTMEQCLYGMLLASANEVAMAIAEHVSGSESAFADLMNKKAKELGCTDSHFVNPNGLPDDAHYTSAYDMALIARAFFADKTLSAISGTTNYHIPATATQPDEIDLMNHHRMLSGCMYGSKYSYSYTVGGKTGYTNVARETLVTCAQKDGKRLICVIMKDEAPNHYLDTKALFEYGFNNFNKLDAYSNFSKDQIDKLIRENLGDVDYKLPAQADIMVPDGVTYSQLSTDLDQKKGNGSSAAIRFYYQDREAGNITFTYSKAEKNTAETNTAVAETKVTQASDTAVLPWHLPNVLKVIFMVVIGLGMAALILLLVRSCILEKERKRRRKELMERSRRRRQQRDEDQDDGNDGDDEP